MNRFFKKTAVTAVIFILLLSSQLFAVEFSAGPEIIPSVKKELNLSFTGDMMAHVINYSMSDYSLIYKDIRQMMTDDSLTFCNVEFPVNPDLPQASFPVFNIHSDYVKAALDAGVDVLSIANNHTADQGTKGLIATVQSMENLSALIKDETGRNIYFSGAKQNPDIPFRPVTIYKDGWKIGYLAVTQFSNVKPEEGYMQLVDFRNPAETDAFVDWISEITENYDLFVLAYHGGVEYYTEPVKSKTVLFRRLAAAGVDVVWGHHPHVVQPVDIVENNGRRSVLMYSLGNFISGQGRIADPALPEEEWSYTGDSAIIQVTFDFSEGAPVLKDVEAVPIANIMTTDRDVVITPLQQLTHDAVPEPWMSYFLERYVLMHDYFIRNIRYPG